MYIRNIQSLRNIFFNDYYPNNLTKIDRIYGLFISIYENKNNIFPGSIYDTPEKAAVITSIIDDEVYNLLMRNKYFDEWYGKNQVERARELLDEDKDLTFDTDFLDYYNTSIALSWEPNDISFYFLDLYSLASSKPEKRKRGIDYYDIPPAKRRMDFFECN